MQGTRIGSVFGIPTELDSALPVVLPLLTRLIGSDVTNLMTIVNDLFGSTIDGAVIPARSMQWVFGSTAAIGLFVGVLFHESGHSLVTVRYGYEIESITLWLFDDVARLKEIPEGWKQGFTIAVAGPVISVVIGVAPYVDFLLPLEPQAPVQFVLGYLALMNVSLIAFNTLPGFPMDGGYILRALLMQNHPHTKTTQIATGVDKVLAPLLGLFGLFFSLFLAAFALFIYMGASGETQQTVLKATSQDVVIYDVIAGRKDLDVVDKKTSIAELLGRMFVERHTGYPVPRDGDLVGMVTLDDARGVREVKRDASRVDNIMDDGLTTITPDADAVGAIALVQERDVGRPPVVNEVDELVGLVSRSDLVTALSIICSRGSLGAIPRSDADLAQLR